MSHRWSAKFGEHPSGDPDLLYYVGELLFKGTRPAHRVGKLYLITQFTEGLLDAAEPHLLSSGTRDSARLLADVFLQWAGSGPGFGLFAIRGVIPFVLPLTHSLTPLATSI